ncbi:MAG: sugar phosphate isomerase/epimerase [Deferribacteres bacterium]|nr:sugar phosphate isomerase/epimerase [candidate division KSB1 bacterium]MCB9509517.1 sugar phosphate isomerase/epimerase [Deferribacteres bacterium]
MKIAFVTDEISLDVEEAVQIGTSWGIYDYELRVIGDKRVPHFDEATVQQLLQLKEKYKINYTALSPGTFKCTLKETEALEHEMRTVLPETCRLAKLLGTDMIITFGFQRYENEPAENQGRVVLLLKEVAALAEEQGLMIAVENEPGFWCDSGQNTARILRKVRSTSVRANWDPGNAVGSDERPYPEGYEAIKEWIVNVHVKDSIKGALVECVPVGEGKIDWTGQLQAIKRERLVEHVTIETHCLPLVEKSAQNLKTVREILGLKE